MCLILFANRVFDDAPMIVAANRDEFYARQAAHAQHWHDAPTILAGRDLEAGGTWLGVATNGRFAAVTNFTEVLEGAPPPGTRGALPSEFLRAQIGARAFAEGIDGPHYRGFNLLLSDGDELVYVSNRDRGVRTLPPGVYALSNTHFDTPLWKATSGVDALRRSMDPERLASGDVEPLLALLADETVPPDHELPRRGREIEFERRVAPRFIRGEEYGTRASTIVVIGRDRIRLHERRFGPNGRHEGDVSLIASLSIAPTR
jgi:uncharacterized protein with NRDE domain